MIVEFENGSQTLKEFNRIFDEVLVGDDNDLITIVYRYTSDGYYIKINDNDPFPFLFGSNKPDRKCHRNFNLSVYCKKVGRIVERFRNYEAFTSAYGDKILFRVKKTKVIETKNYIFTKGLE